MSQPGHNSTSTRTGRESLTLQLESSVITRKPLRQAIPVPILKGAAQVHIDPRTAEKAQALHRSPRHSSLETTAPSQDSSISWSKEELLTQATGEELRFETSQGAIKAQCGAQAASALRPLPTRSAASALTNHWDEAQAGKPHESQVFAGFQERPISKSYQTMKIPYSATNPRGMPHQAPVVVNRATPKDCSPFSKDAYLDLQICSGNHLDAGINSEPDTGHGRSEIGNRRLIKDSRLPIKAPSPTSHVAEAQHPRHAPITRTAPQDTATTAFLQIKEDTVDAAEPQGHRHQVGQSNGYLTTVDTTQLASGKDPSLVAEDGFHKPPGHQSTLQPARLSPHSCTRPRNPARTSDLFPLPQSCSAAQDLTRDLSLSPENNQVLKTHPQAEGLATSERCQTAAHGTTTAPAIKETIFDLNDQGQSAMSPGTLLLKASEIESSPASTRSGSGSNWEENDTPMTSPCASPKKFRPMEHRFPDLRYAVRQVDGTAENSGESETLADGERDPRQADNDPSSVVDDNGSSLSLAEIDRDQFTPRAPASPAKDTGAFPFPHHAGNEASIKRVSTSRRPSALLSHCERNATPRQRRLMTTGMQTPDRFIPNRVATPKETFSLSKPKARTQLSNNEPISDPFGPIPARSLRMAERYVTIRSPPPTPRPVGMLGTLVREAQHTPTRAASAGTIWTVGGTVVTEGVASITNGRGGRVTSGTSASHYTADFLRKNFPSDEEVTLSRRLALAMEIDQSARMLDHSSPSSSRSPASPGSRGSSSNRVWKDVMWGHDGFPTPTKASKKKDKDVPIIPFRVLDAPALRDDYYCSLLAYSTTIQCLAVGLGPHVYLWSENRGERNFPDSHTAPYGSFHVTSVSFSSRDGGNAILAIGRADGRITLWSPLDRDPRFDSEQPAPVSCVCFRPNTVKRTSLREPTATVGTEELLVGDEVGYVYYYSIQWPKQEERDLFDWHGSMTLLARITCHSQQVCGIAWSPDGACFTTGGNDNQLFLFESKKLLRKPAHHRNNSRPAVHVRDRSTGSTSGQGEVLSIVPGQEKQIFTLNAAVKAIAFAPWQSTLLAAGGGSNDRCIHFFHTLSGAKLATIDCHAQVTSLVWSEKRKEIACTFGFAQPEHPYRVAVFTWPSCQMVVRIPWWGEERALFAVAYPRGPRVGQSQESKRAGSSNNRSVGERRLDAEGRPWYGKRTKEEGCLVIATSDASIKFHEIWAESRTTGGKRVPSGVLGGSQILEEESTGDIERWAVIR